MNAQSGRATKNRLKGGERMSMCEARIELVPGSHGDLYAVSDGQNTVSISSMIVRRFVLDQVALLAPAVVDLPNGGRLTVYVKRDITGEVAADDGVTLELGHLPFKLTAGGASKLAQVLLAYAALQNPHPNWLLRRESDQG